MEVKTFKVDLGEDYIIKPEENIMFGFTGNRGLYQLQLVPGDKWDDCTIRVHWHVPNGNDPASTLAVDNIVAVPPSVTAQSGVGRATFEGVIDDQVIASADVRYLVRNNSGIEDGTDPEPDSSAWQQFVNEVIDDTKAATDAAQVATDAAENASISETNAKGSAEDAAARLQELKDGIASGKFKGDTGDKGDDGYSPTVKVTEVTGGHDVVITDAEGEKTFRVKDGTSTWTDVTNKPFDTIGNGLTVKEGVLQTDVTIPTKLSDLTDDETHRVVTDEEKVSWGAKSDFSGSYSDLTDVPDNATKAYVNDAIEAALTVDSEEVAN